MAPTDTSSVEAKNTIVFNASKQEMFKLNENFKILHRKLKLFSKIVVNKEEISPQVLQSCMIIILGGSQLPFEENEINCLKDFINNGGRVFVLLTESRKDELCNINILLESFGIVPNIDCVIRTHYYKYFHPKECYVSDSQINSTLNKDKLDLNFIYPFGCTLSVSKPSVVAFTSGSASFPVDRSIAALYYDEKSGGRLVAVGSGYMFSDKYIDQECNDKLREMLMDFMVGQEHIYFAPTDHDDIESTDHNIVPDTAELAEKPKLCLTDAISHSGYLDYTKLFDHKVYSMNTNLVPEALKLYKELGVNHESLKIITPKFEAPYPPLQPAVFPPSFRDLSPPPLELFDLDDAFSSVFSNLAQFTNKCLMNNENDDEHHLEFYITECSKILNIEESRSPSDVLHEIGNEISKFKSIETIKL
ncbi:intraflagellar transport 52 [Leptinotarsa decemlineata]|uniref:intraflagellar transport 52 n=1 Tax=Leptinotarsa decemlineata TaxID=7539 RepID=UPI000C252CB8|nr:intraflagellar transport protein 52 homolog [Leptinotarsa decemlineata]